MARILIMEGLSHMPQVKDLMSTDLKTVTLLDNVYEIALIMAQHDCGFVPVVDEQDRSTLLGVVTDRDLVVRGYAEKRPGSASVREVMSEALVTVSPTEDAEEAADKMAHYQIRRLPVIDNGKLVGILAIGDLSLGKTTGRNAGRALHEISEGHQQQFLQ